MDFSAVLDGLRAGAVALGFPAAVAAMGLIMISPRIAAWGVRMVKRVVG